MPPLCEQNSWIVMLLLSEIFVETPRCISLVCSFVLIEWKTCMCALLKDEVQRNISNAFSVPKLQIVDECFFFVRNNVPCSDPLPARGSTKLRTYLIVAFPCSVVPTLINLCKTLQSIINVTQGGGLYLLAFCGALLISTISHSAALIPSRKPSAG